MKNKPMTYSQHQLHSFMIDTYSWTKLFYLSKKGWDKIILKLIKCNNIYVTREVMREVKYRHGKLANNLEYVTIFPKITINFIEYEKLGFDKADASLIEYYRLKQFIVITEDHPMIAYATTHKMDFIQLIDFFAYCNKIDQLSNNELYKFARELREMKNITKHKHRDILKILRK